MRRSITITRTIERRHLERLGIERLRHHQPRNHLSSIITTSTINHAQRRSTTLANPSHLCSLTSSTSTLSSHPIAAFHTSTSSLSHAAATPAHATPMSLYEATIASGHLRPDPRQKATVQLLEQTYQQLLAAKQAANNGTRPRSSVPVATPVPSKTNGESSSGGGFFGFAKKFMKQPAVAAASASASTSTIHASSPFQGIRGLYLHGGVGSGKTMLMNQFYDCIINEHVTTKAIRRHFHSFMLDIHRRLHKLRKEQPGISDPISVIARELVANECEVLALDEFQVTDVADAMILKQLFTTMWSEGCVMVATSNRPPEELYKNGLNRQVFLPFIDELKSHCLVHSIEEGQDHRLLGTIAEGVYHVPVNAQTTQSMRNIFDRLAGGTDPERRGSMKIPVMMGRELFIPLGSSNKNVAQFSFTQLCESNVGAADYIALVSHFKYVMLTDIPILYFHQREKIRRFITFLDVAYEHHTRLILQADAPPLSLFREPTKEMVSGGQTQLADQSQQMKEFEGIKATTPQTTTTAPTTAPSPTVGVTSAATTKGALYDEQFASSRAISRLIEMSSSEYLSACAKERDQVTATPVYEATESSRTRQHLESEKAAAANNRQQQHQYA